MVDPSQCVRGDIKNNRNQKVVQWFGFLDTRVKRKKQMEKQTGNGKWQQTKPKFRIDITFILSGYQTNNSRYARQNRTKPRHLQRNTMINL